MVLAGTVTRVQTSEGPRTPQGSGFDGSDRQAEKSSLIPRAEIRANKPEFPEAGSQTCVAELPPARRPSHKRSVSYPPRAHAPLNCRWPPGHRRGIPLLENQDKPYPMGALGPVAAGASPLGWERSRVLKAGAGPAQCQSSCGFCYLLCVSKGFLVMRC